jgi:hypothetical protein
MLVDPNSKVFRVFQAIKVIFSVFEFMLYPFYMNEGFDKMHIFWTVVMVFCQLVFTFDIILNFLTPIRDFETDGYITSKKLIAKGYILKRFTYDVILALPLGLILKNMFLLHLIKLFRALAVIDML